MKFLIIQISDNHCHYGPAFSELAKITRESTREYCELHGYEYLFLDENPDPSRQISWGRTFLTKEKLKDYDWILAIDADLMIMNHTIKLEHLIDERYDIVVAANEEKVESINTGSILWRTSRASEHIIDMMYEDLEFANKGYWEQSTLIKLLRSNVMILDKPLKERVKIVSPRWMNSFYHYWFLKENYESGDFCVHLAGSNNDFRHETLLKLKEFIIRPRTSIPVQIWDR